MSNQDLIEEATEALNAAVLMHYRTVGILDRMEDLLTRFEGMGILTDDEYGIPLEPKQRSQADEEQIRLFEDALGLPNEE